MPAVDNIWLSVVAPPGAASANLLARAGVQVDLVEITEAPSALGSGITPQGNSLQVFEQLLALNQIAEKRYPHDGIGLRASAVIGDWVADTFAELTPGT